MNWSDWNMLKRPPLINSTLAKLEMKVCMQHVPVKATERLLH